MVSTPPRAFDPHEPLRHPKPVIGTAEAKTRSVVLLTLVTAIGEVTYGTLTRSMALVADGWHMATHVGALALTAAAYWYARTHATRDRFSFGPGKIYALAGFTNAVLLLFAALWLVVESVARLVTPEAIDFAQAIPVAVVGLAVNLVSAVLLHGGHDHGHDHAHGHSHGHEHGHAHAHGHSHGHDHAHGQAQDRAAAHDHGHDHGHGHAHTAHAQTHAHAEAPRHAQRAHERAAAKAKGSPLTHDHNLKAAYLHVVADALTSLLAIVALLVGRETGFTRLDPLMGVAGAVVIARWAWGLLSDTSRPLLDMVPAAVDLAHLREVLEDASAGEVVDMHVWEMGPNEVCCVVALAAHKPVDIETCRRIVTQETAVDHLTIELRPCAGEHERQARHAGPAKHEHAQAAHGHPDHAHAGHAHAGHAHAGHAHAGHAHAGHPPQDHAPRERHEH
jgi:cation diffusion facilitator family transporter